MRTPEMDCMEIMNSRVHEFYEILISTIIFLDASQSDKWSFDRCAVVYGSVGFSVRQIRPMFF